MQHMFRRKSGRYEQLMNLSPVSVITNGHNSVKDHSSSSGFGAVVHYYAAQYRTIGNGNHFSFLGADAGHEQCLLKNFPDFLPDPHEVANLEGSHISKNGPCDGVRHGRA